MNAKENYLAAIHFNGPEWVPLGNENIWHSLQLDGNFRMATWTDHWGIGWEVGLAGTVPFPKHNPLPDLDRLADYPWPDPRDLVLTEQHRHDLAKVDRGQHLVMGHLTYLLFERAWAVMGMENFLMAMLTHPCHMRKFLHGIADYARRVFDRYIEMGVDGVGFSEDLGTQRALIMSPSMFREFILPEYVYCFENALRAGKIVHFHSCGCIEDVAADLANIGVQVLNPIQARANDLGKIKTDTIGKMALHGAIDTAVLASGTPADVRHEVIRVMEILKPGGGYICAPDQSIPGIPPENMEALWQTAGEVGRY